MAGVGGLKHAFLNAANNQADQAFTGGTPPAAVAGFKVAVKAVAIVNGTTASAGITFNSKPAGSGTAVSATFTPAASGSVVLPETANAWFESNVGEGLTVTTGATGSVAGIQISYQYYAA